MLFVANDVKLAGEEKKEEEEETLVFEFPSEAAFAAGRQRHGMLQFPP